MDSYRVGGTGDVVTHVCNYFDGAIIIENFFYFDMSFLAGGGEEKKRELTELQSNQQNVRNICILAHVDHGNENNNNEKTL